MNLRDYAASHSDLAGVYVLKADNQYVTGYGDDPDTMSHAENAADADVFTKDKVFAALDELAKHEQAEHAANPGYVETIYNAVEAWTQWAVHHFISWGKGKPVLNRVLAGADADTLAKAVRKELAVVACERRGAEGVLRDELRHLVQREKDVERDLKAAHRQYDAVLGQVRTQRSAAVRIAEREEAEAVKRRTALEKLLPLTKVKPAAKRKAKPKRKKVRRRG